MKSDIKELDDIKLLVNTFYSRVQKDEKIGPIFASRIQDWTPHLEKMYRFWQTILLHEHTYSGSPFPPHATLPVHQDHFDAWLGLWQNTVDELFEGENAEEAKKRGKIMAQLFHYKIEHLRNNPSSISLI